MIIFTNVRKSIDYKGFITQNVHPAKKRDMGIYDYTYIAL